MHIFQLLAGIGHRHPLPIQCQLSYQSLEASLSMLQSELEEMDSQITVTLRLAAPPGTATPYWLLFERYLDYMREHRKATGEEIDVIIKPPDVAINAYFMALAA